MPNLRGLPGEMPAPQPCTTMHSTDSRRRGLINESNCTQTSKCPYTCVCNPGQTHRRRRDLAHIGGHNGCRLQDALLCTLEVKA
jgi:hypothetical protein